MCTFYHLCQHNVCMSLSGMNCILLMNVRGTFSLDFGRCLFIILFRILSSARGYSLQRFYIMLMSVFDGTVKKNGTTLRYVQYKTLICKGGFGERGS